MNYEPIAKLSTDMARASKTLSSTEARFLVDAYYTMQDNRIRADGQIRSMASNPETGEVGEPHEVLDWLAAQNRALENQIKRALGRYVDGHMMGGWLTETKGVGPVIAAGLLAHIDIEKAPTAGAIWSYAGLVPGVKWERGKVRPWNAQLKTLCWKLGESFVKVGGLEGAHYGHVYIERKEFEIARNDAGGNAEAAAKILAEKNFGKTTDAFKHLSGGKLPPAQIHARAKRYAVKLFLAHMQQVWYERHFGEPAPKPYPIAHLGHAHKIEPFH